MISRNWILLIKKSLIPNEQNEKHREDYQAKLLKQVADKLVFIDETSAYVGINREYAWSSSNSRANDKQPKGKKKRVSLIAACSMQTIMTKQALVVEGSVDKNTFRSYAVEGKVYKGLAK